MLGQIINSNNQALPNVQISISNKGTDFKQEFVSDTTGSFQVCGIPLGQYIIRFDAKGFQPYIRENIFLEPSQTLYIKVIFKSKEASISRITRLDYSNCIYQTILDESQINELPSAHNVWSLIENQDLSATTNRIDTGGLWGSIPALYSSRGSCSWTQNIYLLNGMDVTDPYWTGKPLFFADFYALRYTQLINAAHPVQALNPGGYFNLMTKEETNEYHGSISIFNIHKFLQSSNISPALRKEGIFESHSFNHLTEGNFHLSGPIIPGKISFFSSVSAFDTSRNLADYEKDDKSSVLSGLLSLKFRYSISTLRLLWTGQILSHPSFGAERNVPFSSTSDRRDLYNVFQAIWDFRIRENNFLKAGLCFSHGDIRSSYQNEPLDYYGKDIFNKIPSGAAPLSSQDKRSRLNFLVKGESLFSFFPNARYKLQYGFQLQHCVSSSLEEIKDNLHLHFFQGLPLEIVKYNTPIEHQESAFHLNLFIQNTLTLSNFFSFYFGFNLASSRGGKPGQSSLSDGTGVKSSISWLNIAPRVGFIIPLSKAKTSALKISFARYYFTLPLHYLTYGNPDALGGSVYTWNDQNKDNLFQENEIGTLIRREGPFFSRIDPDLKRPYTDEVAISYACTFSSNWYFSLGGFYRATNNLIKTVNIGVPFSEYDPVYFIDDGDDMIPFSSDDLLLTVYNQKKESLGQDFFLLSNWESDKRVSNYFGFDLNLIKKFSSKFTFFLSLTAIQADGTTNPGNTEWENDDGLIGTLYDNPNTLINATGRLRFDRGYTGRLGFNYLAPFDIRIACIIKYYDGQPFARKIIITGFNQGPFYIMAHPRGVARYEYNRTIDIRIEKQLNFGEKRLRIILDGFNILNRGLATEENEWTGPEFPLRFATEIQSPRVFRIGLAYEF